MIKIVLWLFLLNFLLGPVHGSTLMVDPNQTIQSQIERASPGDIILLMNGSYHENVIVDKPIIMRSMGMSVIDSSGNGSAITIAAAGAVLEGLVIRNSTS
jgi:nitrous oxidase accessory protein